jgi:hypothetical protein
MFAETFSTFGGVQTSLYSCNPANCMATLSTWYTGFNGNVTCDLSQQRCFTQDGNGLLYLSTATSKAPAPFPSSANQVNIALANTGAGGISLTAAGGFLYSAGGPNGGSAPFVLERIPEDGSTSVVTRLANMGAGADAVRPPVYVTSTRAYFTVDTTNVFGPAFIFTVTLPLGNGNNPAPMFAGSTDFEGGTYYADANGVYWFDTTAQQLVTCPANGCTGSPTPVASGTSGVVTSDGQALYWVVAVNGMSNIMKLAR